MFVFWMSGAGYRPPVGVCFGATVRNNNRLNRLRSFDREEGDLLRIILETVLKLFEDLKPLF